MLSCAKFYIVRYVLENNVTDWLNRNAIRNTVCKSIQNAAARFLTGASWRDHISPVLRSLHCLAVEQRVDYKLVTLVYKSLRGQAPSYLVDDCQLITDSERPQLRSAHANVLTVPRLREQTLDLATGVSRSRVREFGTVYSPHCGSLTLNLDTLNDF